MLMSWKGPVESHEVKGAEEQPLTGQETGGHAQITRARRSSSGEIGGSAGDTIYPGAEVTMLMLENVGQPPGASVGFLPPPHHLQAHEGSRST